MEKTTFETLTGTIESEFESYPIAEIIAAYCATHEGKSVSKRDVKALEEDNPTLMFSITNNWTTKSITGWARNDYTNTRTEIVVSYTVKNSKWMTLKELRTHQSNHAYFGAKDKRNFDRAALLNPDTCKLVGLKMVAELTDQLALLHAEIKATIETYELDSGVEFKVTEILKEKTGNEIKFY